VFELGMKPSLDRSLDSEPWALTNRASQRREFVSRRAGHHWPGVAALCAMRKHVVTVAIAVAVLAAVGFGGYRAYLSCTGPRYVAVWYVKVNGYTNAMFSHPFEANLARATRCVLRLESVPVVSAPSGVTNKNAAGIRIVAIADTGDAARRAATDAATLLCINVHELYGFSAYMVPYAEAPHRYSLLRDTLKPKAHRMLRHLRDMLP
jgi:hypothetical protein